MTVLRELFISTATHTLELLADDQLAAVWDGPSVLPAMSIGALVAHTARAVITVQTYLDQPQPAAANGKGSDRTVDAAGYVLAVLPDPSRHSDVNADVLARAASAAAAGHAEVLTAASAALAALRQRLPALDHDVVLAVKDDVAIALDDYLATRIVELVVHVDDLVCSPAAPSDVRRRAATSLPDDAGAVAVGTLAELARRRSSTPEMVRALARAERATGAHPTAF